jgi:hypothetical protein
MPASAIEYENGMSAGAIPLFSISLRCLFIASVVGVGHDKPCSDLACGADGAEKISPLISCIAHSARTRALSRPKPGERALLAYAGLVPAFVLCPL